MRRDRAFAAAALLLTLAAAPGRCAKVLRVCDDVEEPAGLNPYLVFSEKAHTLLQQMLEGLVRFGPDGRIEPALAESWERVDERTTRFHLRRGVVFHDGELFDAEAVKFSIEKYVNPATHFAGAGFVAPVSSVTIIDEYTIDVHTARSDGLLLNRLAAWIHIVPVHYYQEVGDEGFSRRPIGTGPFQFEEWARGREISFSANRRYWMAGRPKIDKLVFRFMPADDLLEALREGRIDLATELPGTRTTDALRSGIRVVKKPTFYAATGAINSASGPLKEKAVRQALNFAVNRAELIRYDLFGNGQELATLTMDGEEGHDASLRPYLFDLERSRKLLREAGYPQGFTLKTAVKAQGSRTARIVADQLARVGIKLDLHFFTDAELLTLIPREHWDMLIAGCPDPMAHSFFIQSIFLYSQSPYSLVKDVAYDQKLGAMIATLDQNERRKLGEKLDDFIYDNALALFLYQRIKTYGVRKGVTFTPSVTGMPYFFDADKEAL